jgi:hypothetical protein
MSRVIAIFAAATAFALACATSFATPIAPIPTDVTNANVFKVHYLPDHQHDGQPNKRKC